MNARLSAGPPDLAVNEIADKLCKHRGDWQDLTLGGVLYGWRQHAALSLRDVAMIIGVSHCTLSRIECGEAPNRVTLAKVLLWLMGSTDEKRKATNEN